jgi:NADH dehydrogenase/NADH:ubiquinone oxidoreductase subunit G
MIHLTIDDQPIQALDGCTLLQAARENGIEIPTLCYHEALLPYGACRLCLVELASPRGSRLVASCAHPCEDRLVVRTKSAMVLGARRAVVELLMATGSQLQLVRGLAAELHVVAPYVELPRNDCVLCGLCVRACREIVGVGAIGFAHRGMERTVSTPFQISSADCIECGTCALVCPTGAIHLDDVTRPIRTAHTWPSHYERRACRLCEVETSGMLTSEGEQELLENAGANQ